MESLAQFRLEQLASRGMRESVDKHDVVRQLPLRQFLRQELEERRLGRLPSLAGMDDQQRALLPDRMLDRDDRSLEHVRMGHGEVLDLDRRNPLAARLDDVFQPVGELHVTIGIDRPNVAGARASRPCLRPPPLALEIARDHPVSPHLQFANRNAVMGHLSPSRSANLSSIPYTWRPCLTCMSVSSVALAPSCLASGAPVVARRLVRHAPSVQHSRVKQLAELSIVARGAANRPSQPF